MVAKKNSDHEIKLFIDTDGELESFTLLKLTLGEFRQFLNSTPNWVQKHNYLLYKYQTGDIIDILFKKLANDHQRANPGSFIDASKKYQSTVKGTRCLLRDPIKHTIKIAKTNDNTTCTINRCIIPNKLAKAFFKQAAHCQSHKENKDYSMDTRDLEKYSFWSKLMNDDFIEYTSKEKK